MARTYDGIDDRLRRWVASRSLFFVGSAPLAADGHVNVSPKGPIGTLRILDSHTVAYLDLVGSGAETAAHVRENGRIAIMLCAFQGPPRIVRLHGRGEIVFPGDERFSALLAECAFDEPDVPEMERAIVVVSVSRISDSCGYGVPLLEEKGIRPHMNAWGQKKIRVGGPEALAEYQREMNATSIDGLQAIDVPGSGG